MEKSRKTWFLIILTITLLVLAIVSESLYLSDYEYKYRTKRFNRILHEFFDTGIPEIKIFRNYFINNPFQDD